MADPSAGLVVGFMLVVLAAVVLVLGLVRRAHLGPDGEVGAQRSTFYAFLALGLWMALTAALASSGALGDFERRPPPFPILVAVTF